MKQTILLQKSYSKTGTLRLKRKFDDFKISKNTQ